MRILAIDTALNSCSLAVLDDGAPRAAVSRPMSAGHAEHLAPMAADLFRRTGLRAQDFARIGVVVGPGQFAGVRIGIAFALGLAIGGPSVVLGVSSLEALTESLGGPWTRPRAAIIDARRGEAYAAIFAKPGAALLEPMLVQIEALSDRVFAAASGQPLDVCGGGAGLITSAAPSAWSFHPAVAEIDPYAIARLVASADPARRPPSPLYLRAPDATPTKPSRFAAVGDSA